MDNRRLFLAATLSLAVLILWQWVFAPDSPPELAPAVEEEAFEPIVGATPATGLAPPGAADDPVEAEEGLQDMSPVEGTQEREIWVETRQHRVGLINRGGQIVSFRLKQRLDAEGEPLELVKDRRGEAYPFAIVGLMGDPHPLNDVLYAVEEREEEGVFSVRFRYRGDRGAAEKEFHFTPDGRFEVDVRVEGEESWGVFLGPGLRNLTDHEQADRFQHRALAYRVGSEVEEEDARDSKGLVLASDECETTPADPAGPVVECRVIGSGLRWVALDDNYFLTAVMPRTPIRQARVSPVLVVGDDQGDGDSSFVDVPERELTEKEEEWVRALTVILQPAGKEFQAVAYWGAKEFETLAAMPYGLDETVHWYLAFLARPLLVALRWIHDHIVPNYGWSIVLMTLLIKVALFPLTHKSYISMQKLQKLNPSMEAIRQKYRPKLKDKKGRPNLEMQRKMNEEMQQLFRSEGVNPAGGCLPMILQIPVFIAFYNVLRNAVELWNAPWIFWIQDLSLKDPIYVIPLVMGATQLLQQRLTPMTTANPSQRVLMMTMPFWFTFISFNFPSGLVLYWLTNNVLTIIQQGGYNRLKKSGWFGGEATKEKEKKKPGGVRKAEAKSNKA